MKRTFVAAALTLSIVAAAWPASAQQASAADTQTARDEFHRGQDLFENQGRYAEALVHFRASLAALESPNTLLYVGRCQRELGRPAAAYRAFDRAASLANLRRGSEARFEDTYRSAVRERDAIAALVGFVVFRSTPDVHTVSGVVVGGEALGDVRSDTPIAVTEGDVQLVAIVDGTERRRLLHVVARSTSVWDLSGSTEASPPPIATTTPTSWPPLRIAGLTAAILGVGAVVGGVVTGTMAQSLDADLAMRFCGGMPTGPCPVPPTSYPDVERGATLVTTTNLLIGVGATLVVAGGLGFFLGPRLSGTGSSSRAANTALRTSAVVAPMRDGWMIGFTHAF